MINSDVWGYPQTTSITEKKEPGLAMFICFPQLRSYISLFESVVRFVKLCRFIFYRPESYMIKVFKVSFCLIHKRCYVNAVIAATLPLYTFFNTSILEALLILTSQIF